MAYKNPYSPLVVPEEWTGRLRQFGIQLRGIITDIFVKLRQNKEATENLKGGLGDAAYQAVENTLTEEDEGSVLDARQGKILNDRISSFFHACQSIMKTNETRVYLGIKFQRGYHGMIMFSHPMSGTTAAGLFIVSQSMTTGSTCRITDVSCGEKLTHTQPLGGQSVIFYNDTTTAAYPYLISLREGYGTEKIVYGATQAAVEALLADEQEA